MSKILKEARRSVLSIAGVIAASAVVTLSVVTAASAQKTTLLVYTAVETDQLKAYQNLFEKTHPDISIRWVRDSTGVVTAKLLAEKANPQADAIWGLAASSLAVMDNEGMLQPYAPKDLQGISPAFRDPKNPPAWFGMDIWGATICFNTVEAAKRGLQRPESWKDLTKPIYKGMIVMPHPASSGTGFLDVTAWLQMYGEAEGWKFMDALHENIAQYQHSGSKPCKDAAAGEFPIGISFEYRASQSKAAGAPIDLIFPKEGLGWEMEAFAIAKGTKNLAAAKKLAEFAASPLANSEYAKNYAIVAIPGIAKPLPHLPANYAQLLAKNDFNWAAKNREKILAEWSKRYEGKSAKQ